jgi:nickel-dependent lactate racemase
MKIELNYGKGKLPINLRDDWRVTIVRKHEMPLLADAAGGVQNALARGVGSRSLLEEARGKKSACILICDITRPVPNGLFLGPMVKQLLEAGMAAKNITILVATGLHRPNEGDELAEIVGDEWVMRTVNVANHYARNDEDHVDLGTTARGTRVKLDRRFVQADVRIATGLVEPHFMAGWSGGRKVIAPGVAHQETITTFHSHRFMAHPRAVNCVLEGNPLHEEQLAIVKLLGGAFALNTVIDEHRRLAFVNFGEIVQSHLQAVAFCEKYAVVPVREKFKTVVTSAAGYPLDKTYYQTVKGMVGPIDILAPGGNLIIASECSEGVGSHEYIEAQRRLLGLGVDEFLSDISLKTHAEIDEWHTQMQTKPMKVGAIQLYTTGLDANGRKLAGVTLIDSVDAAIAHSVAQTGDTRVAVVPEGPYVVPAYRPT